jgi:hypothetical protein
MLRLFFRYRAWVRALGKALRVRPCGLFLALDLCCDCRMACYFYQTRRDAERNYPFRVNIPVPTNGFGQTLNTMVEWCRGRFPEWAHHGVTVPARDDRGIAIDRVRFYFIDEIAAHQFRERWADGETGEAS